MRRCWRGRRLWAQQASPRRRARGGRLQQLQGWQWRQQALRSAQPAAARALPGTHHWQEALHRSTGSCSRVPSLTTEQGAAHGQADQRRGRHQRPVLQPQRRCRQGLDGRVQQIWSGVAVSAAGPSLEEECWWEQTVEGEWAARTAERRQGGRQSAGSCAAAGPVPGLQPCSSALLRAAGVLVGFGSFCWLPGLDSLPLAPLGAAANVVGSSREQGGGRISAPGPAHFSAGPAGRLRLSLPERTPWLHHSTLRPSAARVGPPPARRS